MGGTAGTLLPMGEDVVVPAVAALLAAGLALAGAFAQARGARAQAHAMSSSAGVQAEAAHLQWMRSSRQNAYTALLAEAVDFEALILTYPPNQHVDRIMAPLPPPPRPPADLAGLRGRAGLLYFARQRRHRLRIRFSRPIRRDVREARVWLTEVEAASQRLRHAYAVVEMHGPDEVAVKAGRVAELCNAARFAFQIQVAYSSARPFETELPYVKELKAARKEFARSVRSHSGLE